MRDRYTQVDNTTPVVSEMKNKKMKVGRTPFMIQHESIFQAPFGLIMPVNIRRALPNTNYKLSIDALVNSRNPLFRKPLTGARIYFKTYYAKDSDLWEGAPNQKTRGRTGKLDLSLPYVKLDYESGDNTLNCVTPLSLADMLGVPIQYYDDGHNLDSYCPTPHSRTTEPENIGDEPIEHVHTVNSAPAKVNALPFVFYQKVCRKLFNSNVLQDNMSWYPENELDFILPYNATQVNVLDRSNPLLTDAQYIALDHSADGPCCVPQNVNDGTSPVTLTDMHYCQFKGDYFTTGNPFADLMRGDAPIINIKHVAEEASTSAITAITSLAYENVGSDLNMDAQTNHYLHLHSNNVGDGLNLYTGPAANSQTDYRGVKITAATTGTIDMTDVASKIAGSHIAMADIRALQVYTIMKERMALTDGSYNQLVESMFNFNPHMDIHEPEYIGGTYVDIAYNEVISNNGADDVSFGRKTANANSGGSGFCGKHFSPDYGYYMTVAYIVQDTMYTQGIDRLLTDLSYDDVYFPLLEKLSPMPIHNRELFLSGNADIDDLPFAYQERYSFMKSDRNRAHGLCALGPELAEFDNAIVQKRRFGETPSFNNSFLTMSPQNVDMSIFSRYDEPPFDIALNFQEDVVYPLSWISMPTEGV